MMQTSLLQKLNYYLQSVCLFLLILMSPLLLAFDNDKAISDVHLKDESFLDINSHQFRKSLDLLWWDTLSGWRATGGSVSTNRLFLHNDLRLHKKLSDVLSFGMRYEQENLYAKQPAPSPLIFIDIYPLPDRHIGISLIGTPAYDKRQSDMGYAITFGRQPTNFSRLSWLRVDKYYNDKNEFDNSYYEKFADSWRLEGTYKPGQHWIIHYDLNKDTPLNFLFDNQTSRFRHESHDYKLSLVRHISRHGLAGANVRTLNVDKYLEESSSNEGQKIDYYSLDLYWINNDFDGNRELTLGFRYDTFKERLRDYLAQTNSYDFELSTWQAYSSLNYTYSLHQAWDLGLYLAWSDRSKRYVSSSTYEYDDSGIQAKLRTSWQYHSTDKSSVLLITMTFNLDDFIDDPGDGGGIYMQTRF